jgi:SNF2 family DNA or RNA helicase
MLRSIFADERPRIGTGISVLMNLSPASDVQVIPTLQVAWSGSEFCIWGEHRSESRLDAGAGVEYLIQNSSTSDSVVSDSVAYWSVLARYALSLLQREQFIPDLVAEGTSCRGRWQPAISNREEIQWLERYARRMPQDSHCVIDGGESDPLRLVETFLESAIDCLVRRILNADEFFRDFPDRAKDDPRWEPRWLSGLITQDARVAALDETWRGTIEQLAAWTAPLLDVSSEPAPKLVFTLEEPEESADATGARWKLELRFEMGDGTPLDIAAIWRQPVSTHTILGSRIGNRRLHLEKQLHEAGEVCPRLTEIVERQAEELELSTSEAHQFLRQQAPSLRAKGFGVELPAWVDQFQQRLGLQLQVRPREVQTEGLSLNKFGLGTLMEFNWRVALGDHRLTLEDFEKIVSGHESLVRLKGQWIGLEPDDAQKAIDFLRRQHGGQMTLADAIRLAGGVDEIDAGLPIIGLSGADWVEKFLSESPTLEIEPLPQPENFNGVLRPYQERGLSWLSFLDRLGIGSCLADDMGLGKTIQLLALLLHERKGEQPVGPTLLFAPMSVVGNWEREIQRFAKSLKVLVHHGVFRLTGDAFAEAARAHDIVITTYGLAHRELDDLRRVAWHRIAMDEAQKIKNPNANQTLALKAIPSLHRVAMTGTPLENHLIELWSIMDALNPGLLGTASSFRTRFATPIEKLGDPGRAEQLRRLIRPFVLRRLKSDPLVACDLPEKMEMRVFTNLTPEQAALYERTVQSMMGEIDDAAGIRRRGLILATLTKLKQICNHPEHFLRGNGPLDGRSGKCERIVEMLEEVLEEGDAALIFTQYREMGNLLQNMLAERLGVKILYLHGGTTMKQRNEMIEHFQDESTPERIFLLSLKAGGFGLNLTRANHVFHFDRWWNPAVEEQATDRVHRIGQTRRVQVHKFVCIGTVEERIDKLLAEKMALADKIVGSGDEWLTGLSTVELREYLALSKDAVSES